MIIDNYELEKWKNRIWHPEIEYKGKEKNEVYDKLYESIDFCAINFDSKDELYEFLDYGMKNGKVKNNFIKFIRGDIFDIYIVSDYRDVYKAHDSIVEFIEDNAKGCKSSWIVCDGLNTEFDYNLAGYLCTKLKAYGCNGIIYHVDKDADVTNDFYYCISNKNICNNYKIVDGEIYNNE